MSEMERPPLPGLFGLPKGEAKVTITRRWPFWGIDVQVGCFGRVSVALTERAARRRGERMARRWLREEAGPAAEHTWTVRGDQ